MRKLECANCECRDCCPEAYSSKKPSPQETCIILDEWTKTIAISKSKDICEDYSENLITIRDSKNASEKIHGRRRNIPEFVYIYSDELAASVILLFVTLIALWAILNIRNPFVLSFIFNLLVIFALAGSRIASDKFEKYLNDCKYKNHNGYEEW